MKLVKSRQPLGTVNINTLQPVTPNPPTIPTTYTTLIEYQPERFITEEGTENVYLMPKRQKLCDLRQSGNDDDDESDDTSYDVSTADFNACVLRKWLCARMAADAKEEFWASQEELKLLDEVVNPGGILEIVQGPGNFSIFTSSLPILIILNTICPLI